MSSFGQIILNYPDRNPSTTSRTEPQRYLDVLDAFFDLVGSEVVVGDQLVALFDGLLQVTGSPAHLVFEGFVLTQQSQRSRQILPIILGGEDLLLLPDPALLQTTETRSGLTGYIRNTSSPVRCQEEFPHTASRLPACFKGLNNYDRSNINTNLFCHLPEELPEASGLLEASSPLSRQLAQLLVAEVHVSDAVADDLRVAGFVT